MHGAPWSTTEWAIGWAIRHPRARRIAALLVGRAEGAIDASSQSELRELDLEALDEHLASLATRGKIYDGDHRVADRASMLEAVRSLGARFPDVLIFDVLPVPPPHLVDATLARAYRAVRYATVEELADAVDELFAITWPLPAGAFG